MGVEALFIENIVSESREILNGKKIYSLWDTYVFADFVTYPSLWEGWGNQLLEAIRAKLPIMLFEYPVYKVDIKDKGLSGVDKSYFNSHLLLVCRKTPCSYSYRLFP